MTKSTLIKTPPKIRKIYISEPIEGVAILWLKASTRGEKKDKIQGKGWDLKVIDNIEDNFTMFLKVYDIYNPLSKFWRKIWAQIKRHNDSFYI